jgi:hypothetical protein
MAFFEVLAVDVKQPRASILSPIPLTEAAEKLPGSAGGFKPKQ